MDVKKRRGRPSLEPDEAKRRRVQRQKDRRKNTVNLGKSQQEWSTLRNSLSYKKDSDFAAFLLNFYRNNNKGIEPKTASVASSARTKKKGVGMLAKRDVLPQNEETSKDKEGASVLETGLLKSVKEEERESYLVCQQESGSDPSPTKATTINKMDSTDLVLRIKQEENPDGTDGWPCSSPPSSHPIFHPGLSLWIKEVDEPGSSDHQDTREEELGTTGQGKISIKKERELNQAEESATKPIRKKPKVEKDNEKYMKLETTFTGSKTLFCFKSMKISRKSKPGRTVKKSRAGELKS